MAQKLVAGHAQVDSLQVNDSTWSPHVSPGFSTVGSIVASESCLQRTRCTVKLDPAFVLYWHLVNTFTGIWSKSVQCADSQSRAEVKRMCECPGEWIVNLVWLNLMLATIVKIHMYHGSCVMYISLCAIRSWNWNWKLTQDHFLIERWIERTHRCSAVRCWPWRVFSSRLASRDLGTTRSSYLAWVGPVVPLTKGQSVNAQSISISWCHQSWH